GVFGAPLKHATKCGSVTAHGLCVPEIVSRCFTEIMKRGLHVEGLFRLSGAASEVEVLQREFDRPPTYGRYLDLAHHDIHAITGVVKKYLRNLPDPVIPTAYHSRFLKMDEADIFNSPDEISTLASLIQEFPVAHYQLTHYIIILISYIQQYSHINLMTAEALAIILTPVCTGLEQTLKDIPNSFVRSTRPHMRDMRHFVETNAKWTHVWHIIIENHRQLLEV
ncbi:Rho GTPase activation protein, partial [Spinellus fusiger]